MTITKEISLRDFEFWGGAKEFARKLTTKEFDIIEDWLSSLGEEFFDETYINDLFWFYRDELCEEIGIPLNIIEARK